MGVLEYQAPTTLDGVFDLLEAHGEDGRVIAGGTALAILMRQRLVRPTVLVSLARVRGLAGVERTDGYLWLGSMTTQREAERHALVRDGAPLLAETLSRVATIRIRNVATLGGNVVHADPHQDPPVALLALDATLHLTSRGGERALTVEEFFVDYYETAITPGEVLTSIRIPPSKPRTGAAFSKFLPRTADDYATVSVASVVTLDTEGRCSAARVALGSVAPTVIRAPGTEASLLGQRPTDEVIDAAAQMAADATDPQEDARGSVGYKRDMAVLWVRRTLREAFARATASSAP